jgi:rod shape-determining protein MreD
MLIAVSFAYRLILGLSLTDLPRITLSLSELGTTVLFYPLVAGVTHSLMGVRKVAPGDLEALGQSSS